MVTHMKKGILFLIFCSMLLATDPALAKDPSLVKKGYNQIKKGYFQNALPTFQKAVKQYPDNANAHLGLALASMKQGGSANFDVAIIHFQRALELDPSNFEAIKDLARILSWDVARRGESLHLYRRALAIEPDNKDIQYQLAEVLNWAGNYYEATELFKPLYKADPTDMKLALNYANALSSSGQYYDSLGLYQQAIKNKKPFDDYTALNYARTLAKTANTDLAIKIYNDVLLKTTDLNEQTNIKKELAGVLFNSGRYEEAILVDSSISDKSRDILLRLARAYDKSGNQQQAVTMFEEIYNTYPNDEEVLRSAAQFLTNIGGYNITAAKIYDTMIDNGMATIDDKISLAYIYNSNKSTQDKAVIAFRSLLQDPTLPYDKTSKIKIDLARLLASNENTRPEAIQEYRQILANDATNLELENEFLELLSWQDSTRLEALVRYFELVQQYPNNPTITNKFNKTLSWYLPTEGDIELYEKILKYDSDNLHALKGLAYVASQYTDNKQKAIDLYKRVLIITPNNIDIQYKIATLLAGDKETRKEAIELLEKINKDDPGNIDIMTTLANNLLYTKQYKKANKIYSSILDESADNKDALLGRARIYGWQGYNLAAYKAYTKVYNLYPYDPDIAYEYASVAKKLGQNAKALEVLNNIKGQSALPDAPGLPVIAMAGSYQAIAVDNQEDKNFNKLQGDLADIERSLEELQSQLEGLEKTNQAINNTNYQQTTNTTQYNAEPVTNNNINRSNTTTKFSDNFDTLEYNNTTTQTQDNNYNRRPANTVVNSNNNYSTITTNNDSLPEPVIHESTPFSNVKYANNYDTSNETPAVLSATKPFEDVIFNPGPEMRHFKATSYQDALSGRRTGLMTELYGDVHKDILYNMRPEIRTSFVFSNEAGNPTSDAMEVHGYPSMFSVNVTPQNRFRFGVNSSTYGMTTSVHPASITMTTYTMGWNTRPHERVMFDAELGISSFSDPNAPVDVTGKAELNLLLHDRIRLALKYRRQPLYESVFETTGYTTQPQYSYNQQLGLLQGTSGPLWNPNNQNRYNNLLADPRNYDNLRGPFMGQVRDNAVSTELTFIPFNKWDMTFGYEYSAVRGENIENNGRHQALFSIGRTFTGVKDHLFRVGYQFLFFGYRKNLSAFPNMTSYPYAQGGEMIPVDRQLYYSDAAQVIANRWASPSDIFNDPTGGTVTEYQSPVNFTRAPAGVGIGGYFSPTQFYLNSLRFDFEGKLFKGRLYYKGGASLGVQQIGDGVDRMDLLAARGLTQYANIAPNDPRRAFPAFAANAAAADSIYDNTDPTSMAVAFDLTGFLKVTDFLTLYSGVDYMNTGAFDRWRYNGGIILRPNIKALSPMFRKPNISNIENDLEKDDE